jgi:hypothetical protein
MVFHRSFFVLRAIISLSSFFNLSILSNTRILPFQLLSVKCPWQRGLLYALNHIRIFWNYFLDPIRFFPIWRPLPELVASRLNKQNHLLNKVSDLKRFFLTFFFIICSSYPQRVFRSCIKSLPSHPRLRLIYRALNYDNLQSTAYFIELFAKHPDLPPRVK